MCEYCSGKVDIIDEYDINLSIGETSKGFVFYVNGNYYKPTINFCPMCGKKLTTFEVNL